MTRREASTHDVSLKHASLHHALPLSYGSPSRTRDKSSTARPRHHQHSSRPLRVQTRNTLFLLFTIVSCCISLSNARLLYIDEQMIESRAVVEDAGPSAAPLAHLGGILVDLSPPPVPASWTAVNDDLSLELEADHDLKIRAAALSSSSSSSSTSTPQTLTTTVTSISTLAPTSTRAYSAATDTAAANSPLPTPFDLGFNNNITDSCQAFMTSMLSNSTFKSCMPFSLLLQNSNSFFQASKSITRITQALDISCAADPNVCTPLLSSFAANLTSASSCASDLASENPLITYAHLGLLAYRPLYTASCLRDPGTSSYCFGEAITNATNPADSYIYYLPLNQSLVGGSQPTCDRCLQNTMAVFAQASADRKSALASDYVAAAMQVNVNCGPNFVNSSLPQALTSAAASNSIFASSWSSAWVALVVVVVGSWLL